MVDTAKDRSNPGLLYVSNDIAANIHLAWQHIYPNQATITASQNMEHDDRAEEEDEEETPQLMLQRRGYLRTGRSMPDISGENSVYSTSSCSDYDSDGSSMSFSSVICCDGYESPDSPNEKTYPSNSDAEPLHPKKKIEYQNFTIPRHVHWMSYGGPHFEPFLSRRKSHVTRSVQGYHLAAMQELSLELQMLGIRRSDIIVEVNGFSLIGLDVMKCFEVMGRECNLGASHIIKVRRSIIPNAHGLAQYYPASAPPPRLLMNRTRIGRSSSSNTSSGYQSSTAGISSCDGSSANKRKAEYYREIMYYNDSDNDVLSIESHQTDKLSPLKKKQRSTSSVVFIEDDNAEKPNPKSKSHDMLQVDEGMIGEHCYDDGKWYIGTVSDVDRKKATCTFTYTESDTYMRGVPFIELRGLHYDNDDSCVSIVYKGMISECRVNDAPAAALERSPRSYVRVLVASDNDHNGKIDVRLYGERETVSCGVEDLLFVHVSPELSVTYCRREDLPFVVSSIPISSSSGQCFATNERVGVSDVASHNSADDVNGINFNADVCSGHDGSVWADEIVDEVEEDIQDCSGVKRRSRGKGSIIARSTGVACRRGFSKNGVTQH